MRARALVDAVAFSPDGKTVLTGSWDKTARLWDAATGAPVGEPLAHDDWVSSVAFSPDGRTILTGCYDRTARLWDRETGRPDRQAPAAPALRRGGRVQPRRDEDRHRLPTTAPRGSGTPPPAEPIGTRPPPPAHGLRRWPSAPTAGPS